MPTYLCSRVKSGVLSLTLLSITLAMPAFAKDAPKTPLAFTITKGNLIKSHTVPTAE